MKLSSFSILFFLIDIGSLLSLSSTFLCQKSKQDIVLCKVSTNLYHTELCILCSDGSVPFDQVKSLTILI